MAVLRIHIERIHTVCQPAVIIKSTVRIHEITVAFIINPAVLHTVIVIEIGLASPCGKTIRDNDIRIILKLEVQVNSSLNAVYRTAAGKLPEGRIRIFTGIRILGSPNIEGNRPDTLCQPVFAGIHHGVITRTLDNSTENYGKRSQLFRRHRFMYRILQVKYNRHIHRKGSDGRQRELGLRHGRFYRCRIGIKINACFQPGGISSHHVRREIRIQAAFGASYLDKRKAVAICRHCAPVDSPLVFGYIDPLAYHSGCFRFHTRR